MLAKRLIKFDKHFYVFFVVLVVLFAVVGFTTRSILEAFNKSRSVDPSLLQSTDVRVQTSNLDKALEGATNQELMPLDLPE